VIYIADQNHSTFVFVDRDNDRVMKWLKGANEGVIVVVVGGPGRGNSD